MVQQVVHVTSPQRRLSMDRLTDSPLFKWAKLFLTDSNYRWTLILLIIVGDAVLTQLIIRFIPCERVHFDLRTTTYGSYRTTDTEIDWETYMYHIDLYLKGERDYTEITGPTGPLVLVFVPGAPSIPSSLRPSYPAGHVHVHRFLHSITSSGLNIPRAQQLYGLLYVVSLALSCAICHQAGGMPNWALLLLPLSKRLHSIYVLRLFNDCWSVVAMQAAILAYGQGSDGVGTLLFRYATSLFKGWYINANLHV